MKKRTESELFATFIAGSLMALVIAGGFYATFGPRADAIALATSVP